MLSKISLTTNGVLVFLCFSLYVLYQGEQHDNDILRSNVTTLQNAIEEQKVTISSLVKDKETMNTNIQQLIDSNNQSYVKLTEQLNEINVLRAKEARNALERPYEAGNIRTDRLNKLLQSIAGKKRYKSRNN